MLTVEKIIEEVDSMVPNPFETEKKVTWLNEINNEFFEVVKIPAIHRFLTTAGTSIYWLPEDVRSNKVQQLRVENTFYDSLQYSEVYPGRNSWTIDDTTKELVLSPRSSTSGQEALVRYTKAAKQTLLPSDITVTPEAPREYHWTYVLGLCERVAKAMNDVTLANNYGNDYKNSLLIAQQNYGTPLPTEGA